MSAQRKYARTIDGAFKELVLDGQRMGPFEAYKHFERLSERVKGAEWSRDLFLLINELMMRGGTSMQAATSGTTGPPKRMRIPRSDLVRSARLTADTFGLQQNDRVLLCLPCAYIAGKMMVVRAMALGLDLHVIDPRGGVLDNLKVPDRFRFTAMVPLQLHRAVQEDRARVEQQFQTILLGGGPISAALEEDLQGLRTEVYQSYGSTETVTHVALRRLNGPERSAWYQAIGRVTFSTDGRGCLVVDTPHLSTKRHVTNDLVELHGNSSFHWLGRIDNVILSGGKKIYPEQLEAKTAGIIPFPHYFTAVPDDRLGQAVALVLETEEGAEAVLDELLRSLFNVLSIHEMPRRVAALRAFRRTGSGKVIRHPAT
ncbi:MAG: AMP-binding protein [Flavobacteriales bacterium]|nr:AMP-binding protein [Flavobacteriales bacterium]